MPFRVFRLAMLMPFLAASLSCQIFNIRRRSSPTASTLLFSERQSSTTPTITVATPLSTRAAFTPSPTKTPTHSLTFTPIPSFTLTASTTLIPTSIVTSSLALQLQVFEDLWQIVDENYLYPDFNGLNWDDIHREYRQYIEDGLSGNDFYTAMKEMIYRLDDDHSSYLSPSEAREQDAGSAGEYDYAGIGVMVSVVPERNVATIVVVFPASPAEGAGLRPHDSIISIEEQPVVDEQGNLRRELLRGPEGTTILMTVQSPGESSRQVSIIRQRIDSPLPVPYQEFETPNGKRIGYILLPTFNDQTVDDEIEVALRELANNSALEGLILDDRQNGGGSSQVLLDSLAYFTDGEVGTLVHREDEQPLIVSGKDVFGSQEIPLSVMIGKGTLSFGEVFAGILKDLGRAYLIGTQTSGNVEVLTRYDISDGSRAFIANMTFRPVHHPEQDWEATGITPDLVVSNAWDQFTLETDPGIQAALEYFD